MDKNIPSPQIAFTPILLSLRDLAAMAAPPMSPLELLAAVLILANVALVARRSVWNYAFAIGGVTLYAWVFFEAKLYSDMALQGFFLVVNVYGWRHWSRSLADVGEVRVGRLTDPARLAWLAGIVTATLGWGWTMHRLTDAALPFVDAGIAMRALPRKSCFRGKR